MTRITACALLAGAGFVPATCVAATVTNLTTAGVLQPTATPIDLSSLGQVNWAAWTAESTTATASLSPYATRTGGTGTIGSLLPAGTSTAVRGTDVLTSYTHTFTWTGGTAAPTASGKLTGAFGSNVNNANNGVSFSVTNLAPLAAGQSYQISVLAAAYNGQGTLTATATGSTPVFQLGMINGNSTRQTELFQFSYIPDAIDDELDFAFLLSTDGSGTSSHVTIQAVGISIIPEPSSGAFLMGTAAAGMFFRRRRI